MTEEEAYKVVGRALARVGHHGEEPSPAEVLHHFRSQDFTAAELNELRVKARSGELDTSAASGSSRYAAKGAGLRRRSAR